MSDAPVVEAQEAAPATDAAPDAAPAPEVEATAPEATPSESEAAPVEATTEAPEGETTDTEPGDDWRAAATRGDEKKAKRIARYRSMAGITDALIAAQDKLAQRAEAAAPVLPEDATDEQVAEYRKAAGVPEAPEGYLESLPDGVVIGEDDRPLVDDFLADMHAKNKPAGDIADALAWYHQVQEKEAEAASQIRQAADVKYQDEMRREWGDEFGMNQNAIASMLGKVSGSEEGQTLHDMLKGASMPDGSPLLSQPAVARFLAEQAFQNDPVSTIAPGVNGQASMEGRRAEIEAWISTGDARYMNDPKVQAEYGKILSVAERLQGQSA